jgi:hypothetical protein
VLYGVGQRRIFVKIDTVEAYSLNGINEILPPVFYVFHPILEKRNQCGGSLLTEWYK